MLISHAFLSRILDHIEEGKKAKQVDIEEGENIKQQVDMYMAAKKTIEEQRRKVCFTLKLPLVTNMLTLPTIFKHHPTKK